MGILITDTFTAGDGNTHALLDDKELKGGYRIVDNISDLHTIPDDRRKEGMLVKCLEDDNVYELVASSWNYDITDWVSFSLSDKVSKSGDIMTGGLELPSLTLNNKIVSNIETGELIVSDTIVPSSGAVITLHNSHKNLTNNPHNVTKAQVGLDNVDNTSDVDKPVSTPTQIALDLKSDLSNTLLKDNTIPFSPTNDYNPVTKKYVDDSLISLDFYNDEKAQDAIGNILSNDGNISFTYDDTTPKIIANVDLSSKADTLHLHTKSDIIDFNENDYATGAEGDLANTALQPDDIVNFETSTELNNRDSANRNRANHTGTQSFTTISQFDVGVNFYEKAGYAKGGSAPDFMSIDTEYIVNGIESIIELPPASGSGGRILLISTSGGVGVSLELSSSSNHMNNVLNGTYTFTEANEVVLCINSYSTGWTVIRIDNQNISNFETTTQLNTRDINNRIRSNHVGGQLASTIYDFEAKVLEYEHTGFKKGGNAPATLVDDTTYFLNGVETTLTLPVINSGGERVQLVSNTTTPIRVYPQVGDSLAGVVNGNYNILNEGDVVIFYSDGGDNWYVKNIGKEVVTGWASYEDSTYTLGSPLTIAFGTTTALNNNANSGISTQLPSDASAFWDSTTNKLIGVNDGDKYDIEIRFKAKSNSNSDNFTLNINIGGAIGVINKKTCIFVKAANTEQDFAESLQYFTGSTFLTNGGSIEVTAGAGELSIYDISFLITRTHKGI